MRKNIHKKLFGGFWQKGFLAIAGGLLAVSCTVQNSAYSETDGIYYDPNKDTLPVGSVGTSNRVGEYYDYQDQSVIDKNRQNQQINENRYQDWGATDPNYVAQDSDWGYYTGSQTYYNDWGGFGWGGFGWRSPFGMYGGYGWGMGMGMGFGWNSWGWNPYWDFGFNPYWNMGWGYGGFWGAGYNGWGYPGYGWGYPGYYGGFNSYNAPQFRRSGALGNNGFRPNTTGRVQQSNGFRNDVRRDYNNPAYRNSNLNRNPNFRSPAQGGMRQPNSNARPNPNYRPNNPNYNSTPRQSVPRNDGYRNSDGGSFRSGGNSGGMRSGGFNSGGGSGGGMRSGGGGGGGFRR